MIYSKASNAGYSIVTDEQGNSYVTGSFSDTLHIGDIKLASNGFYDIFLAKFDPRGKCKWARQAGGIDMDEAYGIADDHRGNVYITGYISGKADFSGKIVNGSTNRDFFLTKYDSLGNVLWVNIEAGANEDFGKSVCVDSHGDVYATGVFHGTINTEKTVLKSKSSKNTFVIKHDKDGNFLWATTGVSEGMNEASEINVDKEGNVFVAGTFEGVAEFDKKIIVSNNHKEVFIAKYNSTGKIQWLKKGGASTGENTLTAIAADSTGNIIITGSFSGVAYFGDKILKSGGSKDFFVVKYSKEGEVLWARQSGGLGDENSRSMEVDRVGNIYIAGEFNCSFTFGNSAITKSGDWDIFVVEYSRDGDMIKGSQVSGPGYNKATGISIDKWNNIYLLGYFSRQVTARNLSLETDRKDGAGFIAKCRGFLTH